MSLGIGVMLAVVHSTGKLSAAIRLRIIFANSGAKITVILLKTIGKMLCGSKSTRRLRFFK